MVEGRPSAWVLDGLRGVPDGSHVLDFACGSGRHSIAALQRGLTVMAVDRDAAALSVLARQAEALGGTARSSLVLLQADLEADPWPLEPAGFDAVVVCNYLFRPRLPALAGLLRPGGLMIYETFAQGNERYGRPSNPDYLLASGELFAWAQATGLHVIAYQDGVVTAGRRARIQRLRAVRQTADLEAFALE